MDMGAIIRVERVSGPSAHRRVLPLVAAGVCLALAGCAYDERGEKTGFITPTSVVEGIERQGRIDKEREERTKCYSGDLRALRDVVATHRSEAGAPEVLSLSETSETWRRDYGTGGGGGGGGGC